MSIEEVIAKLEEMAEDREDKILPGCLGYDEIEPLREAAALLKTHPEAQPNEPLTLEELKEMGGQPVWVKSKHFTGWGICCKPNYTGLGFVRNSQCDIAFYAADGHVYFAWTSMGYNERLGAKIYRRPPEED